MVSGTVFWANREYGWDAYGWELFLTPVPSPVSEQESGATWEVDYENDSACLSSPGGVDRVFH